MCWRGHTARMSEHVRVRLEAELRPDTSALNHPGETCGRGGEHEGRLGVLLALEPPQSSQLVPNDRVRAGSAMLGPTDVQGGRSAGPPARKPSSRACRRLESS